MTNQDELRDRIENIILAKTTATPDDAEDATRKIIDDLGLTMETNAAVEGPRHMRRIISEWEWDNQ